MIFQTRNKKDSAYCLNIFIAKIRSNIALTSICSQTLIAGAPLVSTAGSLIADTFCACAKNFATTLVFTTLSRQRLEQSRAYLESQVKSTYDNHAKYVAYGRVMCSLFVRPVMLLCPATLLCQQEPPARKHAVELNKVIHARLQFTQQS